MPTDSNNIVNLHAERLQRLGDVGDGVTITTTTDSRERREILILCSPDRTQRNRFNYMMVADSAAAIQDEINAHAAKPCKFVGPHRLRDGSYIAVGSVIEPSL